MNVIIPAEAGLDIYKAAYVILQEKNLYLQNLVFVYPTKEFTVNPKDITIGMDILREGHTGKNYADLNEVMRAFRKSSKYNFLNHLPDSLMMCYREHDKTVLANYLFKAFACFEKNMEKMFDLPNKIKERKEFSVGNFRIMCVSTREEYLTPEDRIALFKTGFHYIVFCKSAGSGVQKCVHRRAPMLTEFAEYARLNQQIWFTHCRGHLVITKNTHTPDLTVDELCAKLQEFLQTKVRQV